MNIAKVLFFIITLTLSAASKKQKTIPDEDVLATSIKTLVSTVKKDRKTPVLKKHLFETGAVFSDSITGLLINPVWIVPASPSSYYVVTYIKEHPDFYSRNRVAIYNSTIQNGREISPAEVNLSLIKPRTSTYIVKVFSGPGNPLGPVQFLFKNHNYFLYRKNSEHIFTKESQLPPPEVVA